jgi:hypothetical protein
LLSAFASYPPSYSAFQSGDLVADVMQNLDSRGRERGERASDIDSGHFFDEIESGRAEGRKMIGRRNRW